jgi:hypothetical protein
LSSTNYNVSHEHAPINATIGLSFAALNIVEGSFSVRKQQSAQLTMAGLKNKQTNRK